jgi:hypothetical protein
VKLLELPEQAQQMVGAGTIALSAVDQLRAIGQVSPELLDAVIGFIADGNQWAAERLAREPGWVLESALRQGSKRVFEGTWTASIVTSSMGCGWVRRPRLLEEATRLHRQIDRYSYGLPPIRFSEQGVDQARAGGVLIEFEHGRPIIVDRSLYRELAKTAIERTVT